jgi:hypothetical protein
MLIFTGLEEVKKFRPPPTPKPAVPASIEDPMSRPTNGTYTNRTGGALMTTPIPFVSDRERTQIENSKATSTAITVGVAVTIATSGESIYALVV